MSLNSVTSSEQDGERRFIIVTTYGPEESLWEVLNAAPPGSGKSTARPQSTWGLCAVDDAFARVLAQQLLIAMQACLVSGLPGLLLLPHATLLGPGWVQRVDERGVAQDVCPLVRMIGIQVTLDSFTQMGNATFKMIWLTFKAPEMIVDFSPSSADGDGVVPVGGALQRHTEASGMWAFACLVFLALTGELPFCQPEERMQHFWRVKDRICKAQFTQAATKAFKTLHSGAQDFISRLLVVDPQRRLTTQQAMQHPWVGMQQLPELQQWHAATLHALQSQQASPAAQQELAARLSAVQRLVEYARSDCATPMDPPPPIHNY